MPHTRSAKKALRKSEQRRRHNRAVKRDIKTQIKKVLEADAGPIEQLRAEYNLAAKKLDKAAAKRIVHPNLAARKKSQLARLVHAKEAGGQTGPAAK
jgi:small subunit ribosomal protein S20